MFLYFPTIVWFWLNKFMLNYPEKTRMSSHLIEINWVFLTWLVKCTHKVRIVFYWYLKLPFIVVLQCWSYLWYLDASCSNFIFDIETCTSTSLSRISKSLTRGFCDIAEPYKLFSYSVISHSTRLRPEDVFRTSPKNVLWTSPSSPLCNANWRPLPMSLGDRNMTSWGRPSVTTWGRPHNVLYVTPRDVPCRRLEEVSCRSYENVPICSNL